MYYQYFVGLLVILMLLGCGQKGPLYLPDEPAPIHVEKKEQK
jgi:predicted small lipoprotein YifL